MTLLNSETIIPILAAFPVIFFAITVHEFSHAWVAVRCWDPTPERQGRVTLNPLAHFDPFGTFFIVMTVISGFGFGWGKPVMINPMNFRNPRRDEFWVALAGPISNLLQALAFALLNPFVLFIFYKGFLKDPILFEFLLYFFAFGISINLALAFFNLIPLFPLDGEKVLVHSLPLNHARKWANLRPHGMSILIGLLVLGWITHGKISIIYWWIILFSTPCRMILDSLGGFILTTILQT